MAINVSHMFIPVHARDCAFRDPSGNLVRIAQA